MSPTLPFAATVHSPCLLLPNPPNPSPQPADIFLELAKLCRYAKREDIGIPAFVVFFLSWLVCRVLIFPAFVIRSTLFEPVVLVAAYLGIEPRPHWEIFNTLLLVLFALNVFWTVLIFKVG